MIRVFWFNGGVWHEDVPESEALNRVHCYTSMGYLTWWRRLDEAPPPRVA
jgi:hypothetical protein